jgi:hypothetical protein
MRLLPINLNPKYSLRIRQIYRLKRSQIAYTGSSWRFDNRVELPHDALKNDSDGSINKGPLRTVDFHFQFGMMGKTLFVGPPRKPQMGPCIQTN